MRARILGTGKTGCMKNEIVLDVLDAMVLKNLVEKAIDENKGKDWKSYEDEKYEKFMIYFDMAFTTPSKMEEAD